MTGSSDIRLLEHVRHCIKEQLTRDDCHQDVKKQNNAVNRRAKPLLCWFGAFETRVSLSSGIETRFIHVQTRSSSLFL